MKAILEFNLPEDNYEHETAVNAGKWKSVVYEITERLRSRIKYCETEEKASHFQEINKMLWEELDDRGLSLD